MKKEQHVCPVEHAGSLDNRFRRFFQNPEKILQPYLKNGMTVLEVGCGPGFFTLDMAKMVGESGKVIAVDLQEGMLEKLQSKLTGTELEARIHLHQCAEDAIGITEQVDFVLLFYMVHELPDQAAFFQELSTIVKPEGQILIVEPPFHVSKSDFEHMLLLAEKTGLKKSNGPKMFLHQTTILNKPVHENV